jgi:hypothetical protein
MEIDKVESLDKAFELIFRWGKIRGLINPLNAPKQFMKCTEELGEGCSAYLKDDNAKLEDFLGDYFVTGVILCHQLGKNPLDMIKIALNEIWERKGQLVNGSFVKEEDLVKK